MINWQDVIEISPRDPKFDHMPQADWDRYDRKLEDFLTQFQATAEGQKKLADIQQKYGDPSKQGKYEGLPKLQISLNDNFRSVTFSSGQITLDIRDPSYLAFIDQRTGKPAAMVFESIVAHELYHAADPRNKIGEDNKNPNFETVVEESAVKFTDAYARRHAPEWGLRGAYDNVAGEKPEKILNIAGKSGIETLNEDEPLRRRIEDAVRTVDVRLAKAEEALKNGHGGTSNDFLKATMRPQTAASAPPVFVGPPLTVLPVNPLPAAQTSLLSGAKL